MYLQIKLLILPSPIFEKSNQHLMILLFDISHSIVVPVAAEVVVSLILFAGGYFIGKYREKKLARGKNLEEYDFYPFEVDKNNFPLFSIKDFRLAVHYLLKNKNQNAARQPDNVSARPSRYCRCDRGP